jgi:LysR family hydrogen peroxide-inducible transcriptional activator
LGVRAEDEIDDGACPLEFARCPLLPQLVLLLKKQAPEMPLLLEETFTQVLLARLKSGDLDIAILAPPVDEPGLLTQAVYDEISRPHARRSSVGRDQVLDLCAAATKKRGESPHVIEGSSLETIRYMIASGVGLTVMPASAVDGIPPDDPLLCVRRFANPQPTRRIGLVWRATFPRQRALDVVRSAMLDCHLPGTSPSA